MSTTRGTRDSGAGRAPASRGRWATTTRWSATLAVAALALTGGTTVAMAAPQDDAGTASESATPSAATADATAPPTWEATPTPKASTASTSNEPTASEPSKAASPSSGTTANSNVPADADQQTEETKKDPRRADVGVMSVPNPGRNDAVITVKTGGYRTGGTSVSGLSGVRLGFYANQTGGSPLFQCTSDADGDCSIKVPNTGGSGSNRDKRYWVRQIAAPSGYSMNQSLGTGSTVSSSAYTFRTGSELRAGNTYRSTDTFMIGTGSNHDASGGVWQQSLNNPSFPAKCGINVGLVMDLSNSLTNTDVTNLKKAGKTFVDALQGTPSRVGTFTFATNAPASGGGNATLAPTPVSTAAGATTVKNRIDAMFKPGGDAGGTNWDRGLYQVAQSTGDFDVVMVITDGNPTFYAPNAEGPGNFTRFREVEEGIFSANAIKQQGTRVVAVGVGTGVNSAASGSNLSAISGPTKGSDYFQSSTYEQAGDALRQLALGNCSGSVSVVKQVIPSGGTLADAAPAGGWVFDAAGSTGVSVDSPATRTTAAGTGAANFPLSFSGGSSSGDVILRETQQDGFSLVQQSGKNAVCTRTDTGAAVSVTDSGALGFKVTANRDYPISCTVINQAAAPQAHLVVDKKWVVNGTTYDDGEQPQDLSARPKVDGEQKQFGWTLEGYEVGDQVGLDETIGNDLPLCKVTSQELTDEDGTTVSRTLPSTVELTGTANHYVLTNTVSCDSTLTLTKRVVGGTAKPSDWTLDAVAPDGAAAGPHGTTGVTAAVTPGKVYPLAESNGPLEYTQDVAKNAELIPGSSGSWNCSEVDADGNTIPGFADGLNGGVTVPLGHHISCEAVNRTAQLTLVKKVVNHYGGDATPGDFDLSAAPGSGAPAGLKPQTVKGSTTGHAISVRPGQGYALTEGDGPDGYHLTGITCAVNGGEAEPATSVTLAAGQSATCVYTNEDEPGTVTWSKDNGKDSVLAGSEWRLTGPGGSNVAITDCTDTPCSGPDTDPAPGKFELTELTWGDYVLVETRAPAGYTLDGTEHRFTIKATHLTQAFGPAFKNDQVKPVSLPLTGGTGTDAFLIVGGLVLIAGLTTATVLVLRRCRHGRA